LLIKLGKVCNTFEVVVFIGEAMIPKIIHYCWFGKNDKPESVEKYLATWREKCTDYEIIEWNESNFDINSNAFCRESYKAKKWAFVADYVRLAVLYKYGGIYMDTDVEVLKSFDDLLANNGFLCFENKKMVSIGTIGICKQSPIIKELLDLYKHMKFTNDDGTFNMTTNLTYVTDLLSNKYGLKLDGKKQVLPGNILVLPMNAFIAKSYWTGWIMADDDTYAIHHYAASWLDDFQRERDMRQSFYVKKYLKMVENPIIKIAYIQANYDVLGMYGFVKKSFKHFLK
jgi:hypothetical protein